MKNVLNSTGHELKFKTFVKAENCTLFDEKGNQYLDLESGVWCTSLGHSHPGVTRVLAEQAAKMIHSGYCYLNPVTDSAAGKILEITGLPAGKCVFLCSGSEAVEYAVKLVQNISDKPYFMTMKNCYLSAYGSSGERSRENWIEFDWIKGDDPDAVDFTQTGAFVFEPGSSLGLVHFPPKELIRKIVSKVRENGGIIITNEVTTGIGRTGKWFGYNHYDLQPDIVAMGKGLGNGYPVSCVAISEEVVRKINLDSFHYAQSHQNDPLGAAVAKEVIQIIEQENLLQRAEKLGEFIKEKLTRMRQKYGLIREIRGRGLMIAVEFEKYPNRSIAALIHEELLRKNIILVKRPQYEVLRIDPALTIEVAQIDFFLNTMEQIMAGLPAFLH